MSFYGLTDCHHVGESILRPRTLFDTNDSLRARALHTVAAELDFTVTNTWMDADSEQDLFTRSSWSDPAESLAQMDFIMTSRKLENRSVQVLDSGWFKTDHSLLVLSLKMKRRYTVKSGANLCGCKPDDSWQRVAAETLTDRRNWNVMALLLLETVKTHRRLETKEMSVTELELKSLLLRKKRDGRQLGRTELNWLCRAIWRVESAETRETSEQGKCTDGESPKKTKCKHFNWSSIAKQENPQTVLTNFFQDFYSIPLDQEAFTQSERLHWIDCAGGMFISSKKLAGVLNKLKNVKGSPDQITADVLKALHPECVEKLRSLPMMCWEMTFPEDRLCSLTSNLLDKVQAECWIVCDAKSFGLRMAQVTPSTAVRERANGVCAENRRRCWLFLVVASCRIVERMAERNCGGTTGREEGVRSCGSSSCLQGNETARCESVLDGMLQSGMEVA